MSSGRVVAQVGDAGHFRRIYRERLSLSRKNAPTLVHALEKVVNGLDSCPDEGLVLIVMEVKGCVNLLWLNMDLTRVVAHYRGVDRRDAE